MLVRCATGQIDHAVIAERSDGLPGVGVQQEQILASNGHNPSIISFGPISDGAASDTLHPLDAHAGRRLGPKSVTGSGIDGFD
jgi:hypothetical protein